jgi:uncharacterized delta-60 repeat protein
MNRLATALILTAVTALIACSSPTPISNKEPTKKFLGLLEVRIEGTNPGSTGTASAKFVEPSSLNANLSAKAATVIPVNGSSAVNDVQFFQTKVGVLDDDLSSTRFVSSQFVLINRTTTNFENLTLYAVNIPSTTIGGTGIASMTDGSGASITDPSKARAFQPTHAMRSRNLGTEVHANAADLQLFSPSEVNNANPGSLGVQQQAIAQGIIPNTATVLEYGFVATNLLSGRNIAARDQAATCSIVACKGQITLAYKFPKVTPRSSNPGTFKLYYLVANETVALISQSLEEQPANTVAGGRDQTAISQVRSLAGSARLGDDKLNPLCRVRTAVAPDAFLGNVPLPAAAGSLDRCFGATGKRSTRIGSSAQAHAMAIQTDSKIVVAGFGSNGLNNDFALARYNTNGSLDTSFDLDGKVTTDFAAGMDAAFAIKLQPDGKIVVAGQSFNGPNSTDFALARYNTNGSLDTTFSTDGKLTTDISGGSNSASALAIQSDGKIVVAGYVTVAGNSGSSNDFALARYTTTGDLDTTFDTDGIVTTAIGSSSDEAYALAIQNDGKIVAAGFTVAGDGTADFALTRYTTTGILDNSFYAGGKVTTAISAGNDYATALAIQTDGKIVASGFGGSNNFALARYTTNGFLDSTFDADGIVTTSTGIYISDSRAMAIQTNGKIVVAGFSTNDGIKRDFGLARYTTTGALDTSFDTDGKVATAIGIGEDRANAMVIQSDGKVVVAGITTVGSRKDFALARYNP